MYFDSSFLVSSSLVSSIPLPTLSNYQEKQRLDRKRVHKDGNLLRSRLAPNVTVRKHDRPHGSDQKHAVTHQEIEKTQVIEPAAGEKALENQDQGDGNKLVARVTQDIVVLVVLDVENEESQPQEHEIQDVDGDLLGKQQGQHLWIEVSIGPQDHRAEQYHRDEPHQGNVQVWRVYVFNWRRIHQFVGLSVLVLRDGPRPFGVFIRKQQQFQLLEHVSVVHFEVQLEIFLWDVIGHVLLGHVQGTLRELEPQIGLWGVEDVGKAVCLRWNLSRDLAWHLACACHVVRHMMHTWLSIIGLCLWHAGCCCAGPAGTSDGTAVQCGLGVGIWVIHGAEGILWCLRV